MRRTGEDQDENTERKYRKKKEKRKFCSRKKISIRRLIKKIEKKKNGK